MAPARPGGPPHGFAYTVATASQHNIIVVVTRALRPGAASGALRCSWGWPILMSCRLRLIAVVLLVLRPVAPRVWVFLLAAAD